ncbi:MAG: glycosyltransferase family 4 protein [Chloroflexi bacterium]|nr:glycosyltransferase family 4 protein [Chloroflexota bacterium]
MINIALLSGYRLNVGGVESHLLLLMQHGDPARHRWHVIAPTSPRFASQAQSEKILPWRSSCALDIFSLIRLTYLLRQHCIGLLHVHSPDAALLGVIAANLAHIPCVITVHLPAYYLPQNEIKRWLYQRSEFLTQHLADQVIYVSRQVYREAALLGVAPDHAQVIENGIELERFAPRVVRPPSDSVAVSFVGRLEYQKGVDILLQSLTRLTDLKNFKVRIIGDGSQRRLLEIQARESYLDSIIDFVGFSDDAPRWLSVSDIFVLPSRYEAMSMALLEAMASGLPCIVTNVGENAQLITDGAEGFVVPPENAEKLADALAKLIAAPDLRQRMGQAARIKVEQYSGERMAEKTFSLYQSLLK